MDLLKDSTFGRRSLSEDSSQIDEYAACNFKCADIVERVVLHEMISFSFF